MIILFALSLASLTWQDGYAAAPSNAATPDRPKLPACSFDGGAALVERKSAMPPEALSEVERLFAPIGGIADKDEFFEASDAPTTKAPTARFIRAYHVRDIWIVWFERGGIGLSSQTVALVPTLDPTSRRMVLRAAGGSSFQGNLCAGSKAFLAGARSAG